MLTDEAGTLSGLFTDSDLARLLERQRDAALDRPLREVMTVSPTTIASGQYMDQAVKTLSDRKISELPVIDAAGRPIGLIDVTDVVSWLPRGASLGAGVDGGQGAGPSGGRMAPPVPRRSRRDATSARLDDAVTRPFPAAASSQQFHRLE
jgi:hypothetical protein